jgi:hypothetical protein
MQTYIHSDFDSDLGSDTLKYVILFFLLFIGLPELSCTFYLYYLSISNTNFQAAEISLDLINLNKV